MLLISVFLIAALLCTAAYVFMSGGFMFWGCVGVFALSFLAAHVVYLLGGAVLCLFVNRKEAIKKQYPLCRNYIGDLADLVMLYLGVKLHATGLEKLPTDRRFLMVCNHRGAFDPICMMGKLRKHEISCVSKPSNMKIPVLARIAYGMGYLPIDRENDRNALKSILQAADYIKRDVCSMCIYPEGTRSRDGKLLPFHAGSFKIAQRGNVPLVIACISGSDRVFKNFPLRPTRVRLRVLETIPAERVKAMSTQELSDYSRKLIEGNL